MAMLPLQCSDSTTKQSRVRRRVQSGYKEPLDVMLGVSVEGCCEKPKDRIFNEHSLPTVPQLPVTALWIQRVQGFRVKGRVLGHRFSLYPQNGWRRGYDGV